MGAEWKESQLLRKVFIFKSTFLIYFQIMQKEQGHGSFKNTSQIRLFLSDEGKLPRWGANAAGVAPLKENIPSKEGYEQLQRRGSCNRVAAAVAPAAASLGVVWGGGTSSHSRKC